MNRSSIGILAILVASMSIAVESWGQSIIVAHGPVEFCYGESVMLCVEPDTFVSYLWNTGSTTPCIIVTVGGPYWPQTLDSFGNIDSSMQATAMQVTVHHPQPVLGFNGNTLVVTEQFASYQWYFTDSLIVGATDSFLVPTVAGGSCCYTVEVTDDHGCTGNSFCIGLGDGCSTSVSEMDFADFAIYPNPVQHICTITWHSTTTAPYALEVYDIQGRQVVGRSGSVHAGRNTVNLDLSHLPSGIYAAVLTAGDRMTSVKLIRE